MASDPIPRTHPFVGMGKPRYHSNVMIMKLQMTSESCEEGQRAAKSLSITDMGPRHKIDNSLAATSSLLAHIRVWVISGDYMDCREKDLTRDFMDQIQAWLEEYWGILRNLSSCVSGSANTGRLKDMAQQWFSNTLNHNKDDFMVLKASLTDKCIYEMRELDDVKAFCDQAVQAIDDTLMMLNGVPAA